MPPAVAVPTTGKIGARSARAVVMSSRVDVAVGSSGDGSGPWCGAAEAGAVTAQAKNAGGGRSCSCPRLPGVSSASGVVPPHWRWFLANGTVARGGEGTGWVALWTLGVPEVAVLRGCISFQAYRRAR